MDQDTGGFNKAMSALIASGTKTPQQVLLNQAQKLVSSDFTEPGDKVKRGGLFQEARKEAPRTIAEIKALQHKGAKPASEGKRIYKNQFGTFSAKSSRRKASSVENYAIRTWRFAGRGLPKKQQILLEIKRRLTVAGYVQSTGWLNKVWRYKGAAKNGLRLIKNPRGRVIQNLTGNNPSITLINETPGAAEFAAKTGYVDRALANRAQDMAKHTEKKILQAAKKAGFKVA